MPKSKIGVKILAIIVALTVFANMSVFNFELGNIYYAILIGSFFILLITGKRLKFNGLLFWIIAAALISIYINDIPYFFKPYERWIAFVLIISLIGPFILTKQLNLFKIELFKTFNNLLIIIIAISFVGLVLDLPIVRLGRGGFTGVFSHSMLMAPFAAISFLVSLNKALLLPNRKKKLLHYLLAAIGFVACIAAGSRAAIISLILATLFFFYKAYGKNIRKGLKVFIFIFGLGILAYPLWEQYTERLLGKIEYTEEQGNIAITRLSLWNIRLKEIQSSPIFGIGFANDSTRSINDLYKGTGNVEPGSSWLAIIAMIGFIGFIPFVILIYRSFEINNRLTFKLFSFPLYGALLVFFITHMFAEGYVLSAGSGLFFYFWLLLGVIFIFKNEKV